MDKPDRDKALPPHRMASDGEPYITRERYIPYPNRAAILTI